MGHVCRYSGTFAVTGDVCRYAGTFAVTRGSMLLPACAKTLRRLLISRINNLRRALRNKYDIWNIPNRPEHAENQPKLMLRSKTPPTTTRPWKMKRWESFGIPSTAPLCLIASFKGSLILWAGPYSRNSSQANTASTQIAPIWDPLFCKTRITNRMATIYYVTGQKHVPLMFDNVEINLPEWIQMRIFFTRLRFTIGPKGRNLLCWHQF